MPRLAKQHLKNHSYNLRPRPASKIFTKCPVKSRKTAIKVFPKKKAERAEITLCTICQDTQEYKRMKKAKCGHSFHLTCINNWLKESESCPICRGNIRDIPEATSSNQSHHPANPQQAVNQNISRELARASVRISFVWVA